MTVLAGNGGKTVRFFLPDCSMRHSVLLMDAVDKVLKEADLSPSDCEFFAVAVGPGSFTGIRIGISAVKGACLATGKPALPVGGYALSRAGEAPALSEILPPAYLSDAEVLAFLSREPGWRVCSFDPIRLSDGTEAEIVDPAAGLEKAVEAAFAARRFASPEALYIRKSQAEEQLGPRAGRV